MDYGRTLLFPSLFSYFQGIEESGSGQGYNNFDSAVVENTGLVPSVNEDVNPLSNTHQRDSVSSDTARDRGEFQKCKSQADCMRYIRRYLKNCDIPKRARKLICESWRPNTKKSYSTFIKKWIDFCIERNFNPLAPDVNKLLDFLTCLFYDEKLSYSSLNTARSAVSQAFSLKELSSLGSHPLVVQFMKGVFNMKPRLPRTTVTWDTGIVLRFLQRWHPAKILSLYQLSVKVVLLCLLITGQRGQTIWSLDLRNITWKKDCVKIRLGEILKTSTAKHHQHELTLHAYPDSKGLCVVHYLEQYVKRTENLRGGGTQALHIH